MEMCVKVQNSHSSFEKKTFVRAVFWVVYQIEKDIMEICMKA